MSLKSLENGSKSIPQICQSGRGGVHHADAQNQRRHEETNSKQWTSLHLDAVLCVNACQEDKPYSDSPPARK